MLIFLIPGVSFPRRPMEATGKAIKSFLPFQTSLLGACDKPIFSFQAI